jgi:hypothetical protein
MTKHLDRQTELFDQLAFDGRLEVLSGLDPTPGKAQ